MAIKIIPISRKEVEESFKNCFLKIRPTHIVHALLHDDGTMENIVEPNVRPDDGEYLIWIGQDSWDGTWVYHFKGPSSFWNRSDEFLHGYLCAIMDQATWRDIPDDIWGVDAVIRVKDSKLESIRLLQRYEDTRYDLVD